MEPGLFLIRPDHTLFFAAILVAPGAYAVLNAIGLLVSSSDSESIRLKAGVTVVLILVCGIAALVAVRHAANIRRLAQGTEARISFARKQNHTRNQDNG